MTDDAHGRWVAPGDSTGKIVRSVFTEAIESWLDEVSTCEWCGGYSHEPPLCSSCEFSEVLP